MRSLVRACRQILPILLLCAGVPILAESMPVPAKVQAAILKKILVYDKALQGKSGIRFLLVGAEKNAAVSEEIAEAFKELGIATSAIRADELASKLNDSTVAYLLPGTASALVKKACIDKGALSVSGQPSYAENGEVSVSIGVREDGKPLIIIHLAELKAQGHDFSAELLKLAKVVR